jgi:hypothetical protein
MDIVYIGFVLALLAQLGIGRRLINKNGFTAILASLLMVAAIASPLAYYQVSWIKYLLFTWSVVGLLLLIYDGVYKKEKIFTDISLKSTAIFCGVFVIFLWYFRGVNSGNYVYESHDLIYFSWVRDFLRAEYVGALRVSVSWPNLMAANHLMPGAVVSALSIFVMQPTMVTAVELKYVFLALYFTSFILAWAKARQTSIALILFLFFCVFAIYGQEIGYDLRISSFLYIIVFVELIKAMMFNGRDREMVFFALFLIIAKAPIFFVAAVTAAWYLWKAPRDRFRASTIFAFLLVVTNIVSWLLAPTPPGNSMSISITTPLSLHAISALNAVQDWFAPDVVYNTFKVVTPEPVFTLLVVIYILIKYYAVYYMATPLRNLNAGGHNIGSGMNYRDRLIGMDLYVFASLFAWIFVRHNGSIGHVAHAYLLMAFLTTFTLVDNFIIRRYIEKFVALFVCAIIYGLGTSFIDPFSYVNTELTSSASAVKLSSLGLPTEVNGFYIPPTDENPGISQVKAAMYGLKLDSKSTPSPPDSQITHWLIKE